ncbi:MAG TPA: MASE1 domain-containing protein [Opitutaceae bacterium]|jgi:integral membrane sensor domain MASE1|nr:MASE1 domain-containing protein [Opitutaceae bacterium]
MRHYNSKTAWLGLSFGIAITYALTGRLCASLSAEVANVSWLLYIPAGLSLMASLLWGSRVWPAIFVGELLMGLGTHQSLATSTIMACGNGLDAALAGWWFHDRLRRRIELDRVQDVVQLLAAEVLVLQPLSAVIGMLALVTTGHMPPDKLGATAAAWYTANLYAQFVMAPAAIAWLRWPRPARGTAQHIELACLVVVTLVVGAVGPGQWAFREIPLSLTLILVFPLLVWASIRFSPNVAVTVGTALGLFAFNAALAGQNHFSGGSAEARFVSLNIFMSVCICTGLFLAAAAANERRFEAEQASLIEKLQASVEKVSRLEEIVTFCAWTGKVRLDEEWVSVERFLNERYNLNISHGISDDAMKRILADAGLTMPPRLASGQPPKPVA